MPQQTEPNTTVLVLKTKKHKPMSSFKDLISESKPTLIDVYATWCGPCKALASIIQEIKNELREEVNVVKINIDKNQSFGTKHQIRAVPTLMIYRDGELLWKRSGGLSKGELIDKLKSFMVEDDKLN